MGIVQIIWRTNRYVIDWLSILIVSLFFQKTIKPLKLGEETGCREIAVQDPNRIVLVERNRKLIVGFFDRFEMLRCNVAGGTDQSELFWVIGMVDFWAL